VTFHGDTTALFAEYSRDRTDKLRNQLVEAHIGLAGSLAHRFTRRGEPYDDLLQVASVALIGCVERFDADCGIPFSGFATRTITGELKRYFRDRCWAVRAPRGIQELFLEIGPAVELLTQRLGHSPTTAEIADELHRSAATVAEAVGAGGNYHTRSLDRPDGDGVTIQSRLGVSDRGLHSSEERLEIDQLLVDLPDREQRILKLRYLGGLTQSEIATAVGISQMHVSRLLARGLATLCQTAGEAS